MNERSVQKLTAILKNEIAPIFNEDYEKDVTTEIDSQFSIGSENSRKKVKITIIVETYEQQ